LGAASAPRVIEWKGSPLPEAARAAVADRLSKAATMRNLFNAFSC
jgi:hypothetical protein